MRGANPEAAFLCGGGECGALMRARDWAATPLGPPESWPQPLKTLVGVMLGSNQPMFVAWGSERTMLYNDGYAELCRDRHPAALGATFAEVWWDIMDDVGPILDKAFAGEATHTDDIEFALTRDGRPQEAHFAFSYTPVRDEAGAVAGMFCACTETTQAMLGERRLRASEDRQAFLLGFSDALRAEPDADAATDRALGMLAEELRLDRCYVGVYRPEDDRADFTHQVGNDRVPPLPDGIRLSDFPEALRIALDRTLVIDDVAGAVGLSDADVRSIEGLGMRALVAATLRMGENAPLWAIVAVSGSPRKWTPGEIALIEEVTERTWAAVERARAEGALRDSEARFRTLFEQASDYIFTADLDQILTSGNPAAAAAIGYAQEEIVGRSIAEFVAPGEFERTSSMLAEKLKAGGSTRYEVVVVAKDGRHLTWEINSTLTTGLDGKPNGLHVLARDMTEARAAADRLAASEERLRLAQEAAGLGLFDWDLVADRVTVSDGYLQVYGLTSADQVSGRAMLALALPEDRERLRQLLKSAPTGTGPTELEFRIVRPSDGATRWVRNTARNYHDAAGHPVRRIGVVRDITVRKRAEEAVRERAAELEAVLDAVPAAIWIARDPDSRFIDGNRFARELLRMKPDANVSKSAPDADANVGHFRICGSDGEELAVEDLPVQAAARGEVVRDFEERIVFDDGSAISLIGNARALTDAGGRVRGSVAAFVDVTAMKAIEAELRGLTEALETRVAETVAEREAALAQLHEAQKLETLGQLTGGVAHDFNNLLTPIVGSLDLLRRRMGDDPKIERLIDGALQAADRARTLVARLLAFGRRQVLQPRPTDIAGLLHGITDLIQRSIGQHISVVVEPAAALPAARVDPNQLELALLNLAVNARDAMPGGGTLTITAHPDPVERRNEQGLRPGGYVRLSVIDTGTGMDEATCARAIEPFFTTKGVGKGTGLGLSMIHGLAGQMGGALKLSSTVGIGTRVDLWLPVAETAAETAAPAPAGPVRPPAQAATILLVDDEELVRLGAVEMLSELGYAVIEAESGAAALEVIESGAAVDAIVTDYLMPGMNGGELIEAARKARPGLPALIVSGYATLDGLNPNLPLLAKPFRHEAFAEAVAGLLDAKIIPFPRAAETAR